MFDTDLLPAQILFLQNPSKIRINEVIGAIFKDLTLRGVLNVVKIKSFPNNRSRKTQKYFRFAKGKVFEGYEPRLFEKGFLDPLEEEDMVQAKILTNFVLRKYSMVSGFIGDKIFKPLRKDGYISTLPILKTFGYYSLSKKGKKVVQMANEFVKIQEEKLEQLIDGDKGEFINAINETGTFAFQFEDTNPALYKNLISMVKRINRTKPLGSENDLTNFAEAMNIDLSYFTE